jgi:aspartate/methionine/tyrosine aminotransferase
MRYSRMPIEVESPEEFGYGKIRYNLLESSIADRSLKDLGLTIPDFKLQYTEHRGNARLRELVVDDESANLDSNDVLITSGAAGALFIVATSLLTPDSHLLIVRPNYAINLATPRAIGCDITYVDLSFNDSYRVNVDAIRKEIRPDTKLISLTCPHNPSGTVMSRADLDALVETTKQMGCMLMVDEIYRDMTLEDKLPMAASLSDNVISVSSLSKCFGVPGIRIGWLVNKNKKLMETFLAAKEQMNISGSVVDEWIAEQVLSKRALSLPKTAMEMRKRLDIIALWVEQEKDFIEWVRPKGGMVCILRMKREPVGGIAAFYERLTEQHGVYVAPGRWFELPDTYFRIGFGWPSVGDLTCGLEKISIAVRG